MNVRFDSYTCVAKDGSGTQRVLGEGPSADVAETECRKAAMEYLRRRPDTGPLNAWTFHPRGVLN